MRTWTHKPAADLRENDVVLRYGERYFVMGLQEEIVPLHAAIMAGAGAKFYDPDEVIPGELTRVELRRGPWLVRVD